MTTSPGMVAENSMVCRPGGVSCRMPLDIGEEAQVKHLVGLVEDERRHVRQVEVALACQVEEPTGVLTTTSTAARRASIWGS